MKYRMTCLTPTLVGDGSSLSPIDYMVWKDQVNVLDQRRIFRLLARGSRLDGYLLQVKRAEKLDFASWGGFAQNFAGRRIPFEHPSISIHWQKQRAEFCHIPTFARDHAGPVLPGSALRGALRTAWVAANLEDKAIEKLNAQMEERTMRRLGEAAEQKAMGGDPGRGVDPLKALSIADGHAESSQFIVYLLRTASLVESRPGQLPSVGWRMSPRGTVEPRRADDSTPAFAEMAAPGSVFTGAWSEKGFFRQAEVTRSLGLRRAYDRESMMKSANQYAAVSLETQRKYSRLAGLTVVEKNLEELQLRLASLDGNACLLSIGWGGGLLGKSAWLKLEDESYRRLLSQLPFYARAIRSGMPFPKTRRVVFQGNQPAWLPGWVMLEIH